MEDYYQSQPFLMGKAAMLVGYTYTLQNLKQAKESVKDYKPFEIGLVSGPVDPTDPTSTYGTNASEIFAINADSPNKDAAWDFIKFVNGDDYARVKSRSMSGGLMSRMSFNKDYDGQSLDVFYSLKPKVNKSNNNFDKTPSNFYGEYTTIMSKEINLVKENKKSLDEALKTIQSEAQAALDKAVKDEKANKGKEGTSTESTGSADAGSSDTNTVEQDNAGE
jgi:multiple sugar transport system substrate-binding protein